jgi:arginyl-tRNA synthetase
MFGKKPATKHSVLGDLDQLFRKALINVVGKRAADKVQIGLEHPAEPKHGDYSTGLVMHIFAEHPKIIISSKEKILTPFDLANKIVNAWRSEGLPEFVAKVEVAPPGFINIWLQNETLISQAKQVLKEKEKYGSAKLGKGKTVVIDYSSPNIAKPFTIGHLRSTIIGQALYNLYKFLGWETIGDNHLGDWGTQFGKMIVALKRWNKKPIKSLSVADLVGLYVKFHKEAEKSKELEQEARVWFKKLEDGDKEARKVWQVCLDASLKEFNRIYDLLGVKIDYAYGESFYEDKMPALIKLALRKKIAHKSKGALVIEFPELKIPPAMLLKSDGATTYETRDLACIDFRRKRWHPDLYIYEVGVEQKLHFQQTFAAAVKLGFGQPQQFVHVAHGLIRLSGGKMSTRTGKIVYLEEVLNEAITRATKIIKDSSTDRKLTKEDRAKVAKVVGIGAIKYFDLMHHYSTDIVFDWEKMFVLEGNSGPYLQYTYARAKSVLEKSQSKKDDSFLSDNFAPLHLCPSVTPEELALLRTIYQFPEVVTKAAEDFAPNLLCNFLYDLAQKFNIFYNRCSILKADSEDLINLRLLLTAAVAQILANGLKLLGIEPLERM